MPDDPQTLDLDRVTLTSLSQAHIARDGDGVALAFRDAAGGEHGCLMSFEDLGRMMVQLLAVQKSAGTRRRKAGIADGPSEPFERKALLPFPVAHWSVGGTQHTRRVVLRFTSDNDLVWDFQIPADAATSLARDLVRARALVDGNGEDAGHGQ